MDFGMIVDLETTGVDCEKDQIIEIGILEFAVEAGKDPMIVGTYGAVEDPGVPLSPEIEKITGIDSSLIAGRQIDWALVRAWLERASIVIAHNAAFDRSFLEQRQELAGLNIHWACSLRHIDWQGKGFRTRALNYLAADHGFINSFAHRAIFDCATTFRLAAPHLDEMISRSYEREFMIKATGSPFETKDILRERGYRWDSNERVWGRICFESQLVEEREFLSAQVYRGQARHQEVPL